MAALKPRTLDTADVKREMAADLDAKYLQAYASGQKTMMRGDHVSIKGSHPGGQNPQNSND